jgi:cytochrome c553
MARIRSCLAVAAGSVLAATVAVQPARAADPDRGRELYELCAQCHGPAGHGDAAALAPAIAGMGEWYVKSQLQHFRSGTRGTHPQDVGGLRMYPMSLSLASDDDLAAVAAYVASLPAEKLPATVHGDAKNGQTLYALCGACHGADGAGNQQMNAPRLAGTSDWYLVTSLQKFKTGVRGGDPANTNAVMMRGFATQLADEQAMRDVVAYINTLDGARGGEQ